MDHNDDSKPPVPSSPESAPCDGDDYFDPGPVMPDGRMMSLHHSDSHQLSVQMLTPVQDGQSISNMDGICIKCDDGKLRSIERAEARSKGPVQVNSQAYRDGWDSIFGKQPIGEA